MAVGRHRAVIANGTDADGEGRAVPAGVEPAAANHELLGWGIFLAVIAAAAMMWAGIGWPVITGCALLLLVSFVAVWRVQRGTGHSPGPAVAVPEPAAAATLSEPAAEAAPHAPSSTGGAGGQGGPASGTAARDGVPAPLTRKQMRAADPTTGLLPVIPMPGGSVPAAPATVRKGLEAVVPGGRRERRQASAAAAAGPIRPATTPGTAAGGTSGPVILQATAYGPAPEPAVPDAAAGDDSPAVGESRWTRTFGPPETGQLPIQRYVAGPAGSGPADPLLPDRRQRSHSSL